MGQPAHADSEKVRPTQSKGSSLMRTLRGDSIPKRRAGREAYETGARIAAFTAGFTALGY